MKTTAAKESVPLLAAPVLPEDLELDAITIRYDSPAHTDGMASVRVLEKFKVETSVRVNDTFVTFYSVHAFSSAKVANASEPGAVILAKEVRVWNGDNTALLTDGSVVVLCGGSTTCSALKVDSKSEVQALVAKARKALASRYPNKPTKERRLWSTCLD